MPDDSERASEPPSGHDAQIPFSWTLWGRTIHAIVYAVYFLVISAPAVAIDFGIRWYERRAFIEKYGLSPILKWEFEFMAYALATVDCFLFLRAIIQPVVDFIQELRSS